MKTVKEYTDWFVGDLMNSNGAIINGHTLISALEKKLEKLETTDKLYLLEKIGIKCDEIIISKDSRYEEMEFLGMYVSDQYVISSERKPTTFKYYNPEK